ncbi:MAG TPA: polyribonucleotide nucleotidyltransferase [Planctomycetota bacterium]|jgi:polyribonucleotide nucleotidyltransferase|nr:polyribonucleotide nucleotidyltransferase [Planctomycetota bacterium]
MNNNYARVETEIAGRPVILETGQVARQAHGSVIATLGGTKALAAVSVGPVREEVDFFPLTVDYREKTEAAGKIPGGFFKREGRPTTKEILTMRLIDRSIRPLFPDGFRQEVQVMSHVLCYDGESAADLCAMIASFAAVRISGVPFDATLGAARIGHVGGKLVPFPTDPERREESRLDLVVAGHKDGIAMVEAGAKELSEEEMIDALEMGQEVIGQIVRLIDELAAKAGKPTMPWTPPVKDEALARAVDAFAGELDGVLFTPGKHARSEAMDAIRDRCVEQLTAGAVDEKEKAALKKRVKAEFGELVTRAEREMILRGKRLDGRKADEVREITIVPNFIPRQHGSVLFTRGETQALVSVTLGTPDDEQIIDGIEEEYKKHFYLHYNFPPYSVGETRRIAGPGRREIGHGMLAERALAAVLPPKPSFPYTIRIVSDITESNGSSSMASVCGGCLSMMLAGVPLAQPVAGVAMGLVTDGKRAAILTDIQGSEDHHGDMDFKVAGSGLGITALQMDIKVNGVTRELLERALAQANAGRKFVLRKMLEAVPRPRSDISEYAPRMEALQIPSDKIGFLIGPGGKNIKAMQEQYKVRISVLDDTGNVQVFGTDSKLVKECANAIRSMTETPKIGTRYTGTVKSARDFGAFIEILPGVEGLCHISELDEGYVDRVTDVVNVGDQVEVVIINVDDRGKIKLSRKAAMQPQS